MDGFSGFTPEGLEFLTHLAAHNDRDWFAANRAVYDDQLKPGLAALIAATSEAMAARGLPLAGDPKSSQFRIHRDTRFSKDKRPYKTHVSGTLTRDGQRMSPGMVYIHIEPKPAGGIDPLALPDEPHGHGPFIAAGFYLDERADIDAIRAGLVRDPAGWAKVETALETAGLRLDAGAPVKRAPKGFEDQAGGPLEAAIQRTRWIVSRPLTPAEVVSPDLPGVIADFTNSARAARLRLGGARRGLTEHSCSYFVLATCRRLGGANVRQGCHRGVRGGRGPACRRRGDLDVRNAGQLSGRGSGRQGRGRKP